MGASPPYVTIIVNGRFLLATGTQATGVQRVARGLLDAARAEGIDLEVVAPTGADDRRIDRHLSAPRGRFGRHLWEQVLLPAAVGRRPILSLANTAPLAAPRSAVMIHDLATLVGPTWFSPRFRAYGRLSLAAARRARLVLVPSRVVGHELTDRGVREARIVVVRPAVDPRFRGATSSEVERVRAAHGLMRPYLAFVGWADPRKDVATAVAAHLRVAQEVPHDLALIGGAHRNFSPVRLPIHPTVRRLGSVPDDDLVPILSAAAALVYPSRYEGFGLPPLEALACGTPSLVSDIPVLRETLGEEGRFVPPGNVDDWATAMHDALSGRITPATPSSWSWSDAAGRLRAALAGVGWL